MDNNDSNFNPPDFPDTPEGLQAFLEEMDANPELFIKRRNAKMLQLIDNCHKTLDEAAMILRSPAFDREVDDLLLSQVLGRAGVPLLISASLYQESAQNHAMATMEQKARDRLAAHAIEVDPSDVDEVVAGFEQLLEDQ